MTAGAATPAQAATEAAETFWRDCVAIAAGSGQHGVGKTAFTAGAALMRVTLDQPDAEALAGLFRGLAGTAKFDGVSSKVLVGAFKSIVAGVYQTPRLNQ